MNSRRTSKPEPSVERAALLTLVTRATRGTDPDTALDELAGLADAAGARNSHRAAKPNAASKMRPAH